MGVGIGPIQASGLGRVGSRLEQSGDEGWKTRELGEFMLEHSFRRNHSKFMFPINYVPKSL